MVKNVQAQKIRNRESNRPENYLTPWELKDLILVANTLPTAINRKLLADTLGRTEGSIDYVWYDLYRSRKSWRQDYPDVFPEYVQNVLKARKVVGLTRVFTPFSSK